LTEISIDIWRALPKAAPSASTPAISRPPAPHRCARGSSCSSYTYTDAAPSSSTSKRKCTNPTGSGAPSPLGSLLSFPISLTLLQSPVSLVFPVQLSPALRAFPGAFVSPGVSLDVSPVMSPAPPTSPTSPVSLVLPVPLSTALPVECCWNKTRNLAPECASSRLFSGLLRPLGPGRRRLPHHTMPLISKNEGLNCGG